MIQQATTTWKIDTNHSLVQFKVKHLAISNVTGTFNTFEGTIQTNNDHFNEARVHVEIAINSIDTNNTERDGFLQSPAFFDVDKYPNIIFDGKLYQQQGDYLLDGALTIHGITRKVQLNVEYTGTGKGRFGDTRAGFEVSGKINRKDFDLNFALLTETGSLVVGEEIKLHFDVQLINAGS
jgi:polyisoprenoid-binding protein YceI